VECGELEGGGVSLCGLIFDRINGILFGLTGFNEWKRACGPASFLVGCGDE
jgi:hypothetical protein